MNLEKTFKIYFKNYGFEEHYFFVKATCIFILSRYGEMHVAYAESHDQALVGDKTIAFWLMDKGRNFSNLENIVKISTSLSF